ncbi:NAD(P)/FAD-dependent oxidoreductase [Candidatus Parcubacteria bacterium]|nr:NAD(P)/FAD-dependent oxidoreductase [Candidatus Parcubacteria bacterium]
MAVIDYLIIGGGVAGTTAAETIRQRDPAGSIAVVSDEPHRLYSRVLLSKANFFLEKIPFDHIWLKSEAWYGENRIELMMGKQAVRLDPAQKVVVLENGEELQYRKLLLAVGGCARAWGGVAGSDKRGIHSLRTLDDAKNIIAALKSTRPARAVAQAGRAPRAIAVGGGFVSFEMCEMLRRGEFEVALILREPHYWEPTLDEPSGQMIEAALEKGGVKIFRSAQVREVRGGEAVEGVTLQDGTEISCGLIIVGIGVVCPFAWLRAGGVAVGRGILANEYLETSVPDVWVAGDAAEFNDIILGGRVQLGNWVNAQMQGKIAGLNMVGQKQPFKLVSFYTTQGFGITIAFVGDVRRAADRQVITRGSPELGWYVRFTVKDGEVVGATLINRTPELGAISKIIEQNVNVEGREQQLADPAFDLKTFLALG